MTDQQTAGIGDNSGAVPEDVFSRADKIIETGNKWVSERPAIVDDEMADRAGAFLRQARSHASLIETTRLEVNQPLQDQIAQTNVRYNGKKNAVLAICAPISQRLLAYDNAKRAKLAAEQEAARAKAQEAQEAAARAKAESDAILAAANEGKTQGTFADVAGSIAAAAEAEQRAKITAQQASKLAKQKTGYGGEHFTGDNRKSMSRRTREVPRVVDNEAGKLLRAVGLNDGIRAELIKAARAYHKLKGKWPVGIEVTEESSIV